MSPAPSKPNLRFLWNLAAALSAKMDCDVADSRAAKAAACDPIVLTFAEESIPVARYSLVVSSIASSPDGQTLVTGAGEGRLQFEDAAAGR